MCYSKIELTCQLFHILLSISFFFSFFFFFFFFFFEEGIDIVVTNMIVWVYICDLKGNMFHKAIYFFGPIYCAVCFISEDQGGAGCFDDRQ